MSRFNSIKCQKECPEDGNIERGQKFMDTNSNQEPELGHLHSLRVYVSPKGVTE